MMRVCRIEYLNINVRAINELKCLEYSLCYTDYDQVQMVILKNQMAEKKDFSNKIVELVRLGPHQPAN